MKKFTSPGSKAWEQIGTSPQVVGASRAWCMAAMDPAHARKYGCVGVPDNNRSPSVVACNIREFLITENSIPSGIQYYLVRSDGRLDPLASLEKPQIAVGGYIKQVQIYSHPCFGTFLMCEGNTQIFSPYDDDTAKFDWVGVQLSQFEHDIARPISMGHTVQNVGAWSSMGGFFTAGHLPVDEDFENKSSSTAQRSMVIGVEKDLTSYVTYHGGSAAGAYNICRMRNLDAATFFADRTLMKFTPSQISESDEANFLNAVSATSALNQLTSAWEWAFTTYACVTEKFTLRITEYHNVEISRSYAEGGSDGARYDRAALEFVMAILDQHNFCFEAAANDGNRLASKLRLILAKYRPAILAAMAAAGAPTWVRTSANAIINGIASQ